MTYPCGWKLAFSKKMTFSSKLWTTSYCYKNQLTKGFNSRVNRILSEWRGRSFTKIRCSSLWKSILEQYNVRSSPFLGNTSLHPGDIISWSYTPLMNIRICIHDWIGFQKFPIKQRTEPHLEHLIAENWIELANCLFKCSICSKF